MINLKRKALLLERLEKLAQCEQNYEKAIKKLKKLNDQLDKCGFDIKTEKDFQKAMRNNKFRKLYNERIKVEKLINEELFPCAREADDLRKTIKEIDNELKDIKRNLERRGIFQ